MDCFWCGNRILLADDRYECPWCEDIIMCVDCVENDGHEVCEGCNHEFRFVKGGINVEAEATE